MNKTSHNICYKRRDAHIQLTFSLQHHSLVCRQDCDKATELVPEYIPITFGAVLDKGTDPGEDKPFC